jgi:hypothetical protein
VSDDLENSDVKVTGFNRHFRYGGRACHVETKMIKKAKLKKLKSHERVDSFGKPEVSVVGGIRKGKQMKPADRFIVKGFEWHSEIFSDVKLLKIFRPVTS